MPLPRASGVRPLLRASGKMPPHRAKELGCHLSVSVRQDNLSGNLGGQNIETKMITLES